MKGVSSGADDLSAKIQNERHLQTFLLSAISVGLVISTSMLGFMWVHVNEIRTGQQQSAVNIGRLETAMTGIERTQGTLSDRMDDLARDRFTGAEARALQGQLTGLIGELRGEIRANQAEIRKLETQMASYHGTSGGAL